MNKHQAQYLLKHASSLQKEAVNPAGIAKGLKGLKRLAGYADETADVAKQVTQKSVPIPNDVPRHMHDQVTQKGLWPNDAARAAMPRPSLAAKQKQQLIDELVPLAWGGAAAGGMSVPVFGGAYGLGIWPWNRYGEFRPFGDDKK